MSTFAKSAFNASSYSASRPTYPPQLFEYIFSFHRRGSKLNKAQWERAVDLGCGTGQATIHLRPFREVIGVDPSQGMLEKARLYAASSEGPERDSTVPKFSFVQGSAEDLSKAIPENESVDLLVAGQAAHWFDWNKVWPETHRVLRRGGTAAFWVYAEFRLPQFPSLGPKITAYAQGTDLRTSLGTYFQRPGRTILERHLIDVPEPSTVVKEGFEALERVYFCGEDIPPFVPKNAPVHPVLMQKEMKWRDLLAYFRTWSALYTYQEKFPEDLKQAEDLRFLEDDLANSSEPLDELRGGDIAVRFWKDLRQGALEASPGTGVAAEDNVRVEWPVALLLARKE